MYTVSLYCCSSGTVHMSQSDAPFVFPPSLYREVHQAGVSPETAYYINGDLSLSFLKRHLLKGIAGVLLVANGTCVYTCLMLNALI